MLSRKTNMPLEAVTAVSSAPFVGVTVTVAWATVVVPEGS